jgi:hypothetical protein
MANGKDAVARGLGVFSLVLGTAQIVAPRGLARMIGVKDDREHGAVMRMRGLTEIGSGVGILARPRPAGWLWARVIGDAIDVALLSAADTRKPARTAAAMAAVAGVMAPDMLEALRLSRGTDGNGTRDGAPRAIRKAITVNRPMERVQPAWNAFEFPALEGHSDVSVTFTDAPGGRGTEVLVEVRDVSSGALAKLTGDDPATRLSDDLRRFKQVVETGEVVRSDATPMGHDLKGHLKQRPAQPLEEGAPA